MQHVSRLLESMGEIPAAALRVRSRDGGDAGEILGWSRGKLDQLSAGPHSDSRTT